VATPVTDDAAGALVIGSTAGIVTLLNCDLGKRFATASVAGIELALADIVPAEPAAISGGAEVSAPKPIAKIMLPPAVRRRVKPTVRFTVQPPSLRRISRAVRHGHSGRRVQRKDRIVT
jgi:hypothetical protein